MGITNPPVILSLSPLDPSGRGGIQADIETAASLGCYCSPVATVLCSCGDMTAAKIASVNTSLIIEQSRSILEDMPVAAIKIGYPGSVNNVEAIHTVIKDYPSLPVIFQPSLDLWDAESEGDDDLPIAISSLLLPATTVLILSLEEAQILTQTNENINATAEDLMLKEPEYAVMSHPDKLQKCFHYSTFNENGLVSTHDWTMSKFNPDDYGPACTLSSAVAAYLAHGSPTRPAIEEGFRFTQQALSASRQLSFGKASPNRLFWAESSRKEQASN